MKWLIKYHLYNRSLPPPSNGWQHYELLIEADHLDQVNHKIYVEDIIPKNPGWHASIHSIEPLDYSIHPGFEPMPFEV